MKYLLLTEQYEPHLLVTLMVYKGCLQSPKTALIAGKYNYSTGGGNKVSSEMLPTYHVQYLPCRVSDIVTMSMQLSLQCHKIYFLVKMATLTGVTLNLM